MSKLTDLIAKTKAKDPQLAADLEREFKVLSARLPFGLNFERHSPEAVDLPQRKIRKGDKVRVLPDRGSLKKPEKCLWQVVTINKAEKSATIVLIDSDEPKAETVALNNLVVVAESRDRIYPGLISTGKVDRSVDKPFHTVINGENFHVLQALTYTHRGKIDAIYIDPPYNTGAKDWKYNNDYVEGEDLYRHSKWLAMMERRLLIAKKLLNPNNSVLIATIDEKEYLRLGLLLEQTFPEARIQMVITVIKPEGTNRTGEFSRTNEYVYFAMFGDARVAPTSDDMTGRSAESAAAAKKIEWRNLRRRENTSIRSARPNQFYAVFVDPKKEAIHSIGDALSLDVDRSTVVAPSGCYPCFPIKPDGTEMLWGLTPDTLRNLLKQGFARVSKASLGDQKATIQYLASGTVKAILDGEVTVEGCDSQGAIQGAFEEKTIMPKTTWNKGSHNAQTAGTLMLSALIPSRKFPFPKSLYAVEDSLRFFVSDKPQAIILDFFSGSGTTAHSVMRLNRQDGGKRQCISVTNNEVSADEQKALREQGLRPGDPDWEKLGICDYITKPRIAAAITGNTSEGNPIKGDYKFTDEFPMADGFEENAEFFTLTYETPLSVSHNRAFKSIAPLLWMRAGSRGQRIDALPSQGWQVVEAYGLLTDLDQSAPFLAALKQSKSISHAYIVTDDERSFQSIAQKLPHGIEPVRLYESYLTNFAFTHGAES